MAFLLVVFWFNCHRKFIRLNCCRRNRFHRFLRLVFQRFFITTKCLGCIRRSTFEGLGFRWLMPKKYAPCAMIMAEPTEWIASFAMNQVTYLLIMAHQLVPLGSMPITGNSSSLPSFAGDIWTNVSAFIWWYRDYGRPFFIIVTVWAVYGASIHFASDDQHYEYWYYLNGASLYLGVWLCIIFGPAFCVCG